MILILTQHEATPAQKLAGVIDLLDRDREFLKKLLTFEEIPSKYKLKSNAELIADLILPYDYTRVMIGGTPFFMSTLETTLKNAGYEVYYAFSQRVSQDRKVGDEIIKTNVFKHIGFIEA